MSNKHPEGVRDFPASEPWAGLLDEGPGSSAPKKQVPSDEKSVNRALANLQRLTGFKPPTETDQQPLPPVRIFAGHDSRPPTVPEQPAGSTPGERSEINIDKVNRVLNAGGLSGEIARDRLLAPVASHEASEQREERRKRKGLPVKAPNRKVTQAKFMKLTEVDKAILREMRYHPEWIKNPHGETVECMLRDLKRYRESTQSKSG